jgi:hypothetical protein
MPKSYQITVNSCGCSPACDRCACPCHSPIVHTNQSLSPMYPYFEIKAYTSGDAVLELVQPITVKV